MLISRGDIMTTDPTEALMFCPHSTIMGFLHFCCVKTELITTILSTTVSEILNNNYRQLLMISEKSLMLTGYQSPLCMPLFNS